jgi:hypothetical protein
VAEVPRGSFLAMRCPGRIVGHPHQWRCCSGTVTP